MTDIEKMAREAADKHLKYQIEGPEVSGVFDFAEAIAQAVARRCAEVCMRDHGAFGPPAYKNGVQDGAIGCRNMILREFGIRE